MGDETMIDKGGVDSILSIIQSLYRKELELARKKTKVYSILGRFNDMHYGILLLLFIALCVLYDKFHYPWISILAVLIFFPFIIVLLIDESILIFSWLSRLLRFIRYPLERDFQHMKKLTGIEIECIGQLNKCDLFDLRHALIALKGGKSALDKGSGILVEAAKTISIFPHLISIHNHSKTKRLDRYIMLLEMVINQKSENTNSNKV